MLVSGDQCVKLLYLQAVDALLIKSIRTVFLLALNAADVVGDHLLEMVHRESTVVRLLCRGQLTLYGKYINRLFTIKGFFNS